MKDESKKVAAVFLIAFTLRLAWAYTALGDPILTTPLFDSAQYLSNAQEILAEGVLKPQTYLLGPLYAVVLLPFVAVSKNPLTYVFIFQALLDSATAVFVYKISQQVFKKQDPLLPAGIYILYGPAIFYTTAVLAVTVLSFLLTASVYCFLKAADEKPPKNLTASGVLLGLCALGKANYLLILIPYVLFMFQRRPFRKHITLLVVAALLFPLLFVARNIASSSQAVYTSNFGYNLYIGNNPQADGLFTPLDELLPSDGDNLILPVNSSENLDRSLAEMAAEYAVKNPGKTLTDVFKKAMYLLNSYQIPDIYNIRYHSSILIHIISGISLLAPFAMFSALTSKDNRKVLLIAAVMAVLLASYLPFFIKERFRHPVTPLLMVLAAQGLVEVVKRVRERRLSLNSVYVIIVFALLVNNFSYSPTSVENRGMSNPYNNLGVHYMSVGDNQKALKYLELAREKNPLHSPTYNNLGILLNRMGRYDDAVADLEKASELDPKSPYPYNNLGISYYNLGQTAKARQFFKKAMSLDPYYVEAKTNLELVESS